MSVCLTLILDISNKSHRDESSNTYIVGFLMKGGESYDCNSNLVGPFQMCFTLDLRYYRSDKDQPYTVKFLVVWKGGKTMIFFIILKSA